MKEMLNLIADNIAITGNNLIDSITISAILTIAFLSSYKIVALLFDSLGFYNSFLMRVTHWLIRFTVFFSLVFIVKVLFIVFNWIIGLQWWVYLIFGLLFVLILIISIVLKSFKNIH